MLTVGINLVRPTDVVENLDDRIDVITRGFQGLSVACARCHDHKFDPIPQKDYYSLYGVLLNSPDVVSPVPIEEVPAGATSDFFQAKLATRRGALDRFRAERLQDHIREFRTPEVLAHYLQFAWESRDAASREVEALSKEKDLNLYLLHRWREYLNGLVGPSVAAFAALDEPDGAARLAREIVEADSDYRWPDPRREALRLALRGTGSPTDIPVADFWWVQNEGDSNVMKGLRWQYEAVMRNWGHRGGPAHAMVVADAKVPRPAYVFNRGNQHDLGEQVRRRFLTAVPGPPEFRDGSGRLELARVIASADNPLTARVFVNRVWGHMFGEGLVRTPSDFGLRGDRPSHPELLDSLATEIRRGRLVDQAFDPSGSDVPDVPTGQRRLGRGACCGSSESTAVAAEPDTARLRSVARHHACRRGEARHPLGRASVRTAGAAFVPKENPLRVRFSGSPLRVDADVRLLESRGAYA